MIVLFEVLNFLQLFLECITLLLIDGHQVIMFLHGLGQKFKLKSFFFGKCIGLNRDTVTFGCIAVHLELIKDQIT